MPGGNLSSHFNTLAVDGAHQVLQGIIGSGFQTQDATATPLVSPLSVSTAITLNVPDSAAEFNVLVTTAPLLVSESKSDVSTNYVSVPTGMLITFDVAKLSKLYLKGSGGTAVVSFWFNII